MMVTCPDLQKKFHSNRKKIDDLHENNDIPVMGSHKYLLLLYLQSKLLNESHELLLLDLVAKWMHF